MTSPDSPDAGVPAEGDAQQPRRRRVRYGGTHPRRFQERYKELNPEQYPEMQEHIRSRGRTPAGSHVPVLLAEVMECLQPRAGEIIADCTLGYGGHAAEFLRRVGPEGRLVGFDLDAVQIERTRARLLGQGFENISLYRSNFAGLNKPVAAEGLGGYDVIFADLGVSSMQVDDPARGFSYKHEGPLDMRMDDRVRRSAADLLREMNEEQIAEALDELGDEPSARAIAREIVRRRSIRPIKMTEDLVEAVLAAKGVSREQLRQREKGALHPAALTFQALRILVNDELSSLRQLLRIAPHCLRPGGRIGVISFHSGEDRLVKREFRDGVTAGMYEKASEEVIRPGRDELRDNPRSRSAKLRWARAGKYKS